MDLGEEISEAVAREVLEETGVEARFEAIITMRHQHGAAFGRDDLYIGSVLTCRHCGCVDTDIGSVCYESHLRSYFAQFD